MKIRLSVSNERAAELKEELKRLGIEIDPEAELELIEHNGSQSASDYLEVRNADAEHLMIPAEEIIYAESYGRKIEIHAMSGVFCYSDRLYVLEEQLKRHGFLRISNSVIVARKHIKKIRPTLSMKFVLTMSDGSLVDVTRSYYQSFRQMLEGR